MVTLPVDKASKVAISQWAGEAQATFGWVEDREWLVWGDNYLLLNLAKEVCDEKAAAERAQKVAEAAEAKRRREEQAEKEREEREAAAAAKKQDLEDHHRAQRAVFKVKEIDAVGLREAVAALGVEESVGESAEQSQVVESEGDNGEDEMEESDNIDTPAIACASQYPHYPYFPNLCRSSPTFSDHFSCRQPFQLQSVIAFRWKHSEVLQEACLWLFMVYLISIPCLVTVPSILHLLFKIRSFPF
jgi:hypothetical protein